MLNGWLPRRTAGLRVQRIRCRDYGPVDENAPAKGILHTTEGSFESALAVFRRHDAPHFLVGRDRKHRVRVVQLVPLGRTAGALENHPGGVETNTVCRVQIEIVGHSQHTPWLPDPEVTEALARLLAHLADPAVAGIPLRHPVVSRRVARWRTASGVLGHADVPENSHWDPGALRYGELLALAKQHREAATPPRRPWPRRIPAWFWRWAHWRRRPETARPQSAPPRIPAWAWRRLKAMTPKKRGTR